MSATGGYSYKFVQDVHPSNLCGICHSVVKDAVQITEPCGHAFCQSCLDEFILSSENEEQNLKCPTDSIAIDKHSIIPDVKTRRFVQNLEVYCKYVDDGCREYMKLKDLLDHVENCPYSTVECDLECGKQMQLLHLEKHKSGECPRRIVNCNLCIAILEHWEIQEHKAVCPMVVEKCVFCNESEVPRESMSKHHAECPNVEISCTYLNVGCKEKVKRKHLELHCNENAVQHLYLTNDKMMKQSSKMQSELSDTKEVMSKLLETNKQLRQEIETTKESVVELSEQNGKLQDELYSITTSSSTLNFHKKVLLTTDMDEQKYTFQSEAGYKFMLKCWRDTIEGVYRSYCYLISGEKDAQLPWPMKRNVCIVAWDADNKQLRLINNNFCIIGRPTTKDCRYLTGIVHKLSENITLDIYIL